MAAETKWTPGPWRAVREDGSDGPWGWHVKAEGPNGVCGFSLEPDAHLIAAAPDLYSALERLVGCVNGLGKHPVRDLNEAMEEARHALARSSGTGKMKAGTR